MLVSLALALVQITPPPIVRTTPPPPVTTVRTASPETAPFANVGGWQVMVDYTLGSGCFLLMNYLDGTALRMGFNPLAGSGYVLVGNSAWRSLEVGKDYRINLQFDYEEPWQADATGFQFPSGGKQVFLSTSFDRPEFLTEFMAKQSLEITYGGRRVALLDLKGSGAAGVELIRCQEANPHRANDPFSNPSSAETANDPFKI